MKKKIHKVGNSRYVLIPHEYIKQLGIDRDIDITFTGDSIVIKKYVDKNVDKPTK